MSKIVVGVSEFARAHPSIQWAMSFAESQRLPVELVHVVDTRWGHAPEDYIETALLKAEEKIRDLAQLARESHPRVDVESHVRLGSPVNELVTAAEGAQLLVLGSHPETRDSGSSRRTVRIVSLAPCSVVVAPSAVIPVGAGIVVGVDGSAESNLAVQFAARLADAHREPLTVLLAWARPEPWAVTEPFLLETDASEEDMLIVAESIAGLAESYPDLELITEVSASRPETALRVVARDARMLVVGSHGRHGLAKALIGSVSESLVADLPCAVAVIRA